MFSEVIRILAKDGKAIFYPISQAQYETVPLQHMISEIEEGVETKLDSVEDLPESGWRLTIHKK
jgi:hypothetical protein